MGPGGNVPPLQVAGAVLVHPRGDAPQRAFRGRQVVAGRWFAGLLGVGGGQHPVQEMAGDVLGSTRACPAASRKPRSSPTSSAGAVGVADQGEHQRVVQGLRQRAAWFLAQPAGQLMPAVRRGVELGAGEVVGGGARVDVLQLDGRRALQQRPGPRPRPSRRCGSKGPAGRLPAGSVPAARPAAGPRGSHPARPGSPRSGPHRACPAPPLPPACPRTAGRSATGAQPASPGPAECRVPPVQGEHHRHRHLGPDLLRDAPPVAQGGQDQQHSRAALARSRAAGDHQPPRPQPPVHLMQLAHLARLQPLLPGCGKPGQRRKTRRGHCGRDRPGERRGWPSPPNRNGLRLQQPPLTSRPGPLLVNCPGQQVRKPPEFLPGNNLAALAPGPPYPGDPARGDTSHRYGKPRETFQIRAVRRPPHRNQACHRDHRDRPGRGKRPQAANSPTHSQESDSKHQHLALLGIFPPGVRLVRGSVCSRRSGPILGGACSACCKSNDSRHDQLRLLGVCGRYPATVEKGVAKPTCPATRSVPFLLQSGMHRALPLSPEASSSLFARNRPCGPVPRSAAPGLTSRARPGAARPVASWLPC